MYNDVKRDASQHRNKVCHGSLAGKKKANFHYIEIRNYIWQPEPRHATNLKLQTNLVTKSGSHANMREMSMMRSSRWRICPKMSGAKNAPQGSICLASGRGYALEYCVRPKYRQFVCQLRWRCRTRLGTNAHWIELLWILILSRFWTHCHCPIRWMSVSPRFNLSF